MKQVSRGYPTLSISAAANLGRSFNISYASLGKKSFPKPILGMEDNVRFRGKVDYNDSAISDIVETFANPDPSLSANELEESFAGKALQLFDVVPIQALQDLDYWRYLSLFKFRNYIMTVEKDFSERYYGGHGDSQPERWTLIRGFRWGLRLSTPEDISRIYSIRRASIENGHNGKVRDSYITNVVRAKWAATPAAARAFVDSVTTKPEIFDLDNKDNRDIKLLQQRVARTSHNMLFPYLEEDFLRREFLVLKSLMLESKKSSETD